MSENVLEDTRVEELRKEIDFLRKKAVTLEDQCKIMIAAIYNLVVQEPEAAQTHEPLIWNCFLKFCLNEEQRREKGWLLPEDTQQ